MDWSQEKRKLLLRKVERPPDTKSRHLKHLKITI